MDKINEEEIQKQFNDYSAKSEDQLMTELQSADINPDDLSAFYDFIMPMLNRQQADKLSNIMRAMKNE